MRDDDQHPDDDGPRTRLRLNPGGRRRDSQDVAPRGSARPLPALDQGAELLTAGSGVNAVVQAATPLLMLTSGLRGTMEHLDVNGLYEHILREISTFEQSALASGCTRQTVEGARYVLCSFIDEVVMNTPWGGDSVWANRPLLLELHGNTKGGEVVFQMVEQELSNAPADAELLEFLYVCLARGFEGVHRLSESGQRTLSEVRDRLSSRIRSWRDVPTAHLSDHWRGVEDRRSRLVRVVPAWVMLCVGLAIASLVYFPLRTKLSWAAQPVAQKLNGIARVISEPPPCDQPQVAKSVVVGPALASLLANESPEEVLVSEVSPGKTIVVLRGAGFGSASAEVPAQLRALLVRIAAAVAEIGGSVQVEGHSDNLPIRSLKFQDNYELSQARAESAARVIRETVASGTASVSSLGLGSDEPRYLPEDEPANRSLNRRIEIVHRTRGGGG